MGALCTMITSAATLGERMVAARSLSGLTLGRASLLSGVEPFDIASLEKSVHTGYGALPPLWAGHARVLAGLYGVNFAWLSTGLRREHAPPPGAAHTLLGADRDDLLALLAVLA